ncbi:MAG: hypothetical protein NC254_10285 [bacterium]|nr:hypothetical protein [bacterium]
MTKQTHPKLMYCEQMHQLDLERLKSLRTQEVLKNLFGRSATLDVHAVDSAGKEFDVEIQRKDLGAGAKRARHNSSLLDAHILKSGEETEDIPDSYVIFITENDVMKGNQPVYPVERYVTIGEKKVLFGDGSHIIYVNGKYRGDDDIGKLMHDFSCTDPDEMNFEELAGRARYFKQEEKGVAVMCKMMEDMRNEKAKEVRIDNALCMIKDGELSLEKIALYSGLSLEEVKELATPVMA